MITSSSPAANPVPVSTAPAIYFNPNSKDTGWLTLDVCREFTRNKCSRADHQCRFAHPTPNVEIQNGKVTCCFDSIKGKCQRKDPPCKYLHPPQHLKEQLLQNGRNNLMLRHQHMQLINSVLQQQQLLTASTAIYPVVYDANGNKAYSNPVTIAPMSDAHYYTTPFLQQGLYYAPYSTTQHLQQPFNVVSPDTLGYKCNPTDGTDPSSPPPADHAPPTQHLQNQNSVPACPETMNQVSPATTKHEALKMANKVQFYPTVAYNPYNPNNNINNNDNNNYFSCQQMAYATITAPGYAFPIATAILPRY